jgi:hypothetical protein
MIPLLGEEWEYGKPTWKYMCERDKEGRRDEEKRSSHVLRKR